ncbi:UNVERIFIED_CONTAM: Bicaudal D-related protein-like protein [Trichonephila clavipes]
MIVLLSFIEALKPSIPGMEAQDTSSRRKLVISVRSITMFFVTSILFWMKVTSFRFLFADSGAGEARPSSQVGLCGGRLRQPHPRTAERHRGAQEGAGGAERSAKDRGEGEGQAAAGAHRAEPQAHGAAQTRRTEEQLQAQLQTLREQFNVRRSNLHDHVSQLEGLREEINVLEGRKADLGQRIHALTDERENLNLSLEESGDRIILLQRQNREQEQKIRSQQQDLEDLRQTNSQLQAKLDIILRRSPNGNSSLLDEIEMSAPSSMEDDASRVQNHLPNDDIECDDLVLPFSGLFPEGDDNLKHLAQEVIDIYHQLRRLCLELRRRRDNLSVDSGISSTTPEELQAQQVRVGMFTNLLQDFRSLIEDLLAQGPDMPCLACQSVAEETGNLERLQKELQAKSDCLKEKNDEISRLSTKLTIQDTELAALREERDHLRQDVDSSAWAKDEIVKKAWTMRDQAVARKNTVEIELAKTRIELMHINSQLMEAIQQKVELSQQLDQWQLDMQALLDEQMKKKLKNYEQQEDRRPSRQSQKLKHQVNSKGKLFKLFR